jgi:hypothetical protein
LDMQAVKPNLAPLQTPGAQIQPTGESSWRLAIPPGAAGQYRVAQLDDYGKLRRDAFPHAAPVSISLRARASSPEIPGTWGFGLWNNPFSMAVLSGVEILRLPALPNAAWFFFASPPNFLSLGDDLPGWGALAMTFCSPRWPPARLALGAPAVPLLFWPPTARLLRPIARRFVSQAAVDMSLDVTSWHQYNLIWQPDRVVFSVDENAVLETRTVPAGPLGLVMWVDNQYAGLPPGGRLSFGSLENRAEAWIELEELQVKAG